MVVATNARNGSHKPAGAWQSGSSLAGRWNDEVRRRFLVTR